MRLGCRVFGGRANDVVFCLTGIKAPKVGVSLQAQRRITALGSRCHVSRCHVKEGQALLGDGGDSENDANYGDMTWPKIVI